MTIVGGFDVHRAQITFDYLDTDTGEVTRGQIQPATRSVLCLHADLSIFDLSRTEVVDLLAKFLLENM